MLAALAAAALACGLAAGLSAAGTPSPALSVGTKIGVTDLTPVSVGVGGDRRDVGYDRSYKCDLLEKLSKAPRLVVLGGSRAQRFEPSVVKRLTGLGAFNFAVQNGRPADAYAISKYLFWRAPNVRLRCVYALQATTFTDTPMDPALLYDDRLSQWFPASLVRRERRANGAVSTRRVPSSNVYSPRGCLLKSNYDVHRAQGLTLARSLQTYLARVVPQAASQSPIGQSRAKFFFRKLLELYNAHGVEPLIVIMPYQPEALRALRAVGWQKKLERLKSHLARLQGRYSFRVLDYTDIRSFGGSSEAFYDGAHITAENATLILQRAVKAAPECFR